MRNFILSFLFLCIPCLANAQRTPINVDGINYLTLGRGAIVVEGGDYSGDIVIPETFWVCISRFLHELTKDNSSVQL